MNLITKGYFGTSVLDPTAAFRTNNLTRIDQRTYWITPLYPLAQAAWYKVFGFGIFSLRFLSAIWGAVALISWYFIAKILSRDARVALLTTALLAVDFQFVWSASVGRMDMMCCALGQLGLAMFLYFRERSLWLAVLLSQSCVAASGLSHPMGIGAFAGLLFLTLYFDWKRLRPNHAVAFMAPYLIGATAWGLYIWKDPAAFDAQFHGNVADRLIRLTNIAETLRLQIVERYLYMYGLAPVTSGFSHLKILILAAYAVGLAGALFNHAIRQHKGYRVLLMLWAVSFAVLMFVDRDIHFFYLVHFVILLVPIFAIWFIWMWDHGRVPQGVLLAGLAAVMCLNLSVTARRISEASYEKVYLSATRFLKQHASPKDLIFGSSELAFELGFDSNLVDDFRLGYRTGKRPDVVVIDRNRYEEWIPLLERQEPNTYQYIRQMLDRDFHLVQDYGGYRIYERKRS